MKKNFFLFALATMFCCTSFAKIWRVNNTGIPADFTTAQSANDNASVVNGDTLHFEASSTNYGGLTLSKQLVIIGNGYFLGSSITNSNPDLQANTSISSVTTLWISTGGSGSVIMGMTATSTVNIGYGGGGVNNILLRRNHFSSAPTFYTSNNIQMLGCFIDGGTLGNSGNASNLFIANNIITGYISFDGNANGTFQNNIIGPSYSCLFTSFTLRNNINMGSGMTLTTCIVENNIGNATQFGTLNGNQSNVNMANVFIGYPTIGLYSTDGRYKLQNPGPAIGAGVGGVDCGAFGNSTPYINAGMPDVPSIYKLVVPAVVNNNNLNILLSTKINQ